MQRRVAELLKDKILVGHAVFNDLKAGPPITHYYFCILRKLSCRRCCCHIHFLRHAIPSSSHTNSNCPRVGIQRSEISRFKSSEYKSKEGNIQAFVYLIPCAKRVRACVFTSVHRLRMPGPQWRYIVSIAASGKRGRKSSYHLPKIPIARTPPEHRRNGNAQAGRQTTIRPAVG